MKKILLVLALLVSVSVGAREAKMVDTFSMRDSSGFGLHKVVASDASGNTGVGSVLAADAATETLQTTGNAILTTMDVDLGVIAGDTTSIDTKLTLENTNSTTIASDTTSMDTKLTLENTNSSTIASDTTSIDTKMTLENTNSTTIASDTTSMDSKLTTENTNSTAIELNTDTSTVFVAPVVVSVGTSATLLAAIDTTRREIMLQNAGTAPVFIGGSGVTTAAGMILAAGTGGDDGLGGFLIIANTSAWYGIVASGNVNVRVLEVKD